MTGRGRAVHGDVRSGGGRGLHVLAVTSGLPWPLTSGGHLRTFHLLKAMSRAFSRVTLVAPAPTVDREAVDQLRAIGVDVRPAVAGPRTPLGEMARAARAVLRREPYAFYHRHYWREARHAVQDAVRTLAPDVLYLDHLDSFLFAPFAQGTPCVLDLHNVYSTLVARSANGRQPWIAGAYRLEARRVSRMERTAVRSVDLTLSVSSEDAAVFRELGARQVVVVPNGVDCAAYAHLPLGRPAASAPRLVYIGALSWAPNAAAARVLATEILERVRKDDPAAEAHIVGRAPTPEVTRLAALPGVFVHADVPDVRPHLEHASLLVVPLEVGGGTRLKILEAFAAGVPVVSTTVGCEGLDVRSGTHLLVAERAEMGNAIHRLLTDTALGARLAAEGRRLALEIYDWSAVGRTAVSAIAGLVERRSTEPLTATA